MRLTERDAKAAPLLKAKLEAKGPLEELITYDEYGDEWEVTNVSDNGSVLIGRSIYVDGEDRAGEIMDQLEEGWDNA